MISAVTVALCYNDDIEVFDMETGENVSGQCAGVQIQPGQKAVARIFKQDKDGHFFKSSLFDEVACYYVPVMAISGYTTCRTQKYTPGWRDFS